MTLPTIDATNAGANAATTSHGVTLAAGTKDKLIWIWFVGAPGTVTPPGSWTQRATASQGSGGTLITGYCFTRPATSDTSVSVTTTNSVADVWITRVYGGSDIANSTFPTPANATDSAPDPPATGTIASDDYVIDTAAGWGRNRNLTGSPSGYDENTINDVSSSPRAAAAADSLTSITSADPGAYSINNNAENVAFTVAVKPAGAAPIDETGRDFTITATVTVSDVLSGGTIDETGRDFTITATVTATDTPGGTADETGRDFTITATVTVSDVIAGGTIDETGRDFTITATVTATDTPGGTADETGRDFTITANITVLDVWSEDENLTPMVWRVEMALGVAGGVDSLWNTGLWVTTGIWGGSEPSWVTGTLDMLTFRTNTGRDRIEDRFRTATGLAVLDNDTGKYNPDYGAAGPGDLKLRPGRLLRLSGNVGLGYRPVFTGYIDSLPEAYGNAGASIETTLQAYGYAGNLNADDPPALSSPVGAGERTDERVERVLDAYEWPDDKRNIQTGVHTMIETSLARSSLEEIQRAADAEGGAFFIDAFGVATFKAQGWLGSDARSTTAQMYPGRGSAGDPAVVAVNTEWTAQTIVNDVQYTRVGGTMVRVQDTVSQSLYGRRSVRRTDLEVEDDTQVETLADAVIAARAYDRLRIVSLELVPPPGDHAAARALLETELGDLVEVTVDTLRGWSYTVECHVMGIEFRAVADDWLAVLRVDDAVTYSPS